MHSLVFFYVDASFRFSMLNVPGVFFWFTEQKREIIYRRENRLSSKNQFKKWNDEDLCLLFISQDLMVCFHFYGQCPFIRHFHQTVWVSNHTAYLINFFSVHFHSNQVRWDFANLCILVIVWSELFSQSHNISHSSRWWSETTIKTKKKYKNLSLKY